MSFARRQELSARLDAEKQAKLALETELDEAKKELVVIRRQAFLGCHVMNLVPGTGELELKILCVKAHKSFRTTLDGRDISIQYNRANGRGCLVLSVVSEGAPDTDTTSIRYDVFDTVPGGELLHSVDHSYDGDEGFRNEFVLTQFPHTMFLRIAVRGASRPP